MENTICKWQIHSYFASFILLIHFFKLLSIFYVHCGSWQIYSNKQIFTVSRIIKTPQELPEDIGHFSCLICNISWESGNLLGSAQRVHIQKFIEDKGDWLQNWLFKISPRNLKNQTRIATFMCMLSDNIKIGRNLENEGIIQFITDLLIRTIVTHTPACSHQF